jgi:dipeptidyl aminopeptidase/acylaminoacyl peptidase
MKRTLAIILFATAAFATEPLTVDFIMQGNALAGYEPREVRWSPDGRSVYFSWKQASEPLEKEFDTYVVGRDGSGLRKLTEAEAKDAPPSSGVWTRDRSRAVYADEGDLFLYAGGAVHRRALTNTIEAESNPRFTQDERHVTFVRANNLFVLSLEDGSVVQMTNILGPDDKQPLWDDKKGSESQEVIKADERRLIETIDRRAKKREEEEAKKKRAHPIRPFKLEKRQTVADLQLTPDGRFVIASIATESEKAKKTIVPNYVTESAYTEDIPSREKSGDLATVTRIVSLSTADGAAKWLEHGIRQPQPARSDSSAERTETAEKNAKSEESEKGEKGEKSEKDDKATAKDRDVSFGPLLFSEDGSKAALSMRSRDNKDWWLLAFDPATAKTRVLATDHDDAWVRRQQRSSGWMPDGKSLWFVSEASGWAHLYTVPFEGGARRALTSGKWEVLDVALAKDKSSFLLTTSEESLFERHLYRMPIGGGARTKLTLAPGRHDAVVSPDGAAIASVDSYTNRPPELYVGALRNGRAASEPLRVTTSPAPAFFEHAWLDVPIVHYKASDGVMVPARLYKPAGWKRGGPAVIFVHGAGYLQNVHRWWSDYFREYMFHHLLMERGYLVLDADYRGSAGYGRDWRTAIYRHMGGRDLDDEVDAARYLVAEQGVDPRRIGIYGGSYGGFMTLMAMFTRPETFAAGAALRPVTDWAHYNHPYTTDILNTPQGDAEAYRRSSPIEFAAGLQGALLICHGVVDTNVHFQDSVRLAQRLIELRKENWELAIYPMENHSFVEAASWADEYKRILALFERTLKPPATGSR